jgi:hypothetical protein
MNEPLLIGSITKTLLAWYASPKLYIISEYPDLENIKLPTMAIGLDRKGFNEKFLIGRNVLREYPYNIWGFCGGGTTDVQNKIQREKLISDVSALLDDAEFVIYDWSDAGVKGSAVGSAKVKNYTFSKLPQTGTSEADKYRFLFSVTLGTLEEL